MAAPKKLPTTVRIDDDLRSWVKNRAKSTPHGQSGVINDALRLLRRTEEAKRELLSGVIEGDARGE